jgi:hypothetical protein
MCCPIFLFDKQLLSGYSVAAAIVDQPSSEHLPTPLPCDSPRSAKLGNFAHQSRDLRTISCNSANPEFIQINLKIMEGKNQPWRWTGRLRTKIGPFSSRDRRKWPAPFAAYL